MHPPPLSQKVVAVVIALCVGALHFVTGPDYRGPWPGFVNGYLIDILAPFAMHLVMGIGEPAFLRSRVLRFSVIFGVGAISETLQYFGVPLFGRTFDPLDYVMFAVGLAAAAVFESTILRRLG